MEDISKNLKYSKIDALTNPINELSVTEVNKWEKFIIFYTNLIL